MRRSTFAAQGGGKRWDLADSVALGALCVTSVTLSVTTIVRRPDLVKGADFLFQDAGHNLLVADKLLSGQALHRDVFYQYGALSAYVYAAIALVFDNTPTTYLALLAAISALNACLAFILIRRAASTTTATVVSTGLLALLPIPGAIAGGFTVSPYLVLERTLLLVVALLWGPSHRSWRSSVALGASLGVWQGVKFGGAVVAGGAVVLLDALLILAIGPRTARRRTLVRSWMLMCAGFAAIELIWVLVAFRTGPPALALDTLFPLYMIGAYSVAVTPEIRWPLWDGWRLAVGQYLLPLSAGALGLVGLVAWLHHLRQGPAAETDEQRRAGGIFVLLLFVAISTFTYFRHVYHFQQFLWALVPTAAWLLERLTSKARTAVLLSWVPGVLLVVRSSCLTLPARSMVPVSLPTGGSIVVDPAMATRLSFLRRLADEDTSGALVYVPMGSGWQFAYRVPSMTRHSWFFAPNLIRPFEQREFVRALDRTRAVVACEVPGSPETPLPRLFPMPPEIAAGVYERLELSRTEAGCRVYRIRRADFR